MEQMTEAVLFRGGVPYALDVNRLNEAFPVSTLAEGTVIEHAQLEAVLNERRGSQRYYGVVNAWIGKQKHVNGIILTWEPSTGLKVLNPADVLQYAESRTRQKIKQTGKAIRLFAWVDRTRLDETGQKRLDHQMRVANAIKTSIDSARKELAVDLAPIKSLPKLKLVKEA